MFCSNLESIQKYVFGFQRSGGKRIDKKIEFLLKKNWKSMMCNLKPALFTTCVASNLYFCIAQLKSHLDAGTEPLQVVSLYYLQGSFILADASAESIILLAHSLSNKAL